MLLLLSIIFNGIIFSQSASILKNFQLSIVHANDFHARFEEINYKSLTCTSADKECFGGFSRLYAEILKLKREHPDSIILNAGDNFQGTVWYNVYKWKAIQYFMNKIPFDVHTLGNHEFDDDIAGVVPFLRGLEAPTIVANVDDSKEPTIQGLYKKSLVVHREGLKIGIIGAIISSTDQLSNTGKLKFLDESVSINQEAERLVAEENVDTIVVLSHCGYEMDKLIAKNAAPKIGLIVGGHSHSLLYTGTPPNQLVAEGEYPTVITHSDGRKILVVQAFAFTHFLGHLLVTYNPDGDVISWSGSPIHLNESVPQDYKVNKEIAEWKAALDEYQNMVIGRALVLLDATFCRTSECNLGNFLTDAMADAFMESKDNGDSVEPVIAMMNSGAIRNSIKPGNITVGVLFNSQPFQNTFDSAELQGKYIKEALEHSAKPFSMSGKGLLQISGMNVVYNVTKQVGSRVESIKLCSRDSLTRKCEDLDLNKYYKIACNSFLMSGKDGFFMISDHIVNHSVGKSDLEVLSNFIIKKNPITQANDGRIKLVS